MRETVSFLVLVFFFLGQGAEKAKGATCEVVRKLFEQVRLEELASHYPPLDLSKFHGGFGKKFPVESQSAFFKPMDDKLGLISHEETSQGKAARFLLENRFSDSWNFTPLRDFLVSQKPDSVLHAFRLLQEEPEVLYPTLRQPENQSLIAPIKELGASLNRWVHDSGGMTELDDYDSGTPKKRKLLPPVPNLYTSIPADELTIGHYRAQDGKLTDTQTGKIVASVSRSVDQDELHLTFSRSRVDYRHRFINTPETVPLINGKGIPTQMFLTLQFLRKKHIPFGKLRTASVDEISSLRTALQLVHSEPVQQFVKQNPGKDIPNNVVNAAITGTHTYEYVASTLAQAGSRIKSVTVRNTETVRLRDYLKEQVLEDQNLQRLLIDQKASSEKEKKPLSPDTPMPFYFSIDLELEPWDVPK